MDANWKFAEYVILLDSVFIRQTVRMMSEVMASRLGRPLPPLDLVAWLDGLMLDAGFRGKNAEVQVLLTHDAGADSLDGCVPSSLSQLDGQACRTSLGEYVFYAVGTEGMAESDDLYCDVLRLVLNDMRIKKRLLVPATSLDDGRVTGLMRKVWKEMDCCAEDVAGQTVCFRLEAPAGELACDWCSVVPSLAHVLGIRGEEVE